MPSSLFRLPRTSRFGVVENVAEWMLGLRSLERIYLKGREKSSNSARFLKSVLELLQVKYKITTGSLHSIPATGSSVVVANHPFGGIEGIAMAELLLSIRPDVKVLTNEILCRIPELQGVFIGVDILGKNEGRKNKAAVAEARQWVKDGHQLLIFPSGEVSSFNFNLRQIIDPKWRNTASAIARNTNAKVTPVFIEGANGWLFQCLGMIHPRIRTVRLIRELLNKQGLTIGLRIGSIIKHSDLSGLPSHSAATNYLRLHTYLLSKQASADVAPLKPSGIGNKMDVIVEGRAQELLVAEVGRLADENKLINKDDMVVYCAAAPQIPEILKEIGRLREITFREVGEGSGQPSDIDQYDEYYHHLFLWNRKNSEVVGAYRIGQVDKIIRHHGLHGIYTRSLFRYQATFLHKMGPCLEMGRSFVRSEYQKSLSALMLLWKGIGAYVAANPEYRVLFGPVSISSHYTEVSRLLMAGCLKVNNSDQALADLVTPITPLKSKGQFWTTEDLRGLESTEQLSSLIRQIEKDNKGIPVLLRQYLKLSGELAAFNVDTDFNNALDGLIIVDLLRVEERTLFKYMGSERAQSFLNHHKSVA